MKHIDRIDSLSLGKQGENLATPIDIDVTPWLDDFPDGTIVLWLIRPNETDAYPVSGNVVDGVYHYDVMQADVDIPGEGRGEFRLCVGDVQKKSKVIRTVIDESITAEGEAPEPMAQFAADIMEAADKVEAASEHAPKIDYDTKHWLVWDTGLAAWVDTCIVAEGKTPVKGVDYFDGAPGFSPVANVSKSGKTTTISITDKSGTTTAQVLDGEGGGSVTKEAVENALGYVPADEEEVTELKQDITKKLTEPEAVAVGKYFRVASIDSEGHAVLEAVDLPIMNIGQYGVVKSDGKFKLDANGNMYISAPASYGLNWWANDLGLVRLTAYDISQRTANDLLAVNIGKANDVVKATLTDAKRIGTNDDGLTDTEKATACEVLGAVYDGEWETLFDGETESVDTLEVGLMHKYSAFRIESHIMPCDNKAGVIGVQLVRNGVGTFALGALTSLSTVEVYPVYDMWYNGMIWVGFATSFASASPWSTGYANTINRNAKSIAEAGDKLKISQWNSYKWGAGSSFKVYGKRA